MKNKLIAIFLSLSPSLAFAEEAPPKSETYTLELSAEALVSLEKVLTAAGLGCERDNAACIAGMEARVLRDYVVKNIQSKRFKAAPAGAGNLKNKKNNSAQENEIKAN